tara:strand:+ start:204 stop:425 length:222 start_codon:yes stop_codon:yes gene_type:complete
MNIEITEVIDNGDGSVFVGAELDNSAYMAVLTVGLNSILRDALVDCDCDTEDEEAIYEDWVAEELSETETKGD